MVSEISFSCRATSTPSLVSTRSGSMKSAPCSIASRYAAIVCSGRSPDAPRCAMTIGGTVEGGRRRHRISRATGKQQRGQHGRKTADHAAKPRLPVGGGKSDADAVGGFDNRAADHAGCSSISALAAAPSSAPASSGSSAGRASLVEQFFPPQRVDPALQPRGVEPVLAEIVETIGNALLVEPAPLPFHRVAIGECRRESSSCSGPSSSR